MKHMNQTPPPPFNGGAPQPPKKKKSVWLWIIGGFVALCAISAMFGGNDSSSKQDQKPEKTQISKEEWTSRLMKILQNHNEYLDSILPRAKETKSLSMLKGYVSDATRFSDKVIDDSLYMDVYSTKEVQDLMESNSAKAKKVLPQLQKILRENYVEEIKDKLWEENIYVETSNGGTTITFIGGIFASNKNIKKWQEESGETLAEMGFKQVRYKWIKHTDEYTYYDL